MSNSSDQSDELINRIEEFEELDIPENDVDDRFIDEIWNIKVFEPQKTKSHKQFNKDTSGDLKLQIHLVDSSYRIVEVSPSITGYDLLLSFANLIECKYPEYFNLCTKTDDNVENWIDMNKTLEEQNIKGQTNLYFKIKYFKTPRYKLDPTSLELIYSQVNNDILSGSYPTPERIALYLAALQLQNSYADFTQMDNTQLDKYMKRIIPKYIYNSLNRDQLQVYQKRIYSIHKSLYGMSSDDSKIAYLAIAKKIPLYGSNSYILMQGTLKVKIFIMENYIALQRVDRPNDIEWIPFKDILKWSLVDKGFTIRFLKKHNDLNEYFSVKIRYTCDSQTARCIIELLDGYAILMGLKYDNIQTDEGKLPICSQFDYLPSHDRVVNFHLSKLDHFIKSYREESTALFYPLLEQMDKNPLDSLFSSLNLRHTDMDGSYVDGLLKALESNKQNYVNRDDNNNNNESNFDIRRIDVSYNRLPPTFCSILKYTPNLTYLNLSYNNFPKHETIGLSLLISYLHHLEEFHFSGNNLTSKNSAPIIEKLKECKKLKVLKLSQNELKNHICESLAELINNYSYFKCLDISENKINDNGIELFFKSLDGGCKIDKLNLRKNAFGNKGLQQIAEYIQTSKNIMFIYLGGNSFTSSAPLCNMVTSVETLNGIELGGSMLGKKGWKEFFQALKKSTSIQYFQSINGFDKHGWLEFETFDQVESVFKLKLNKAALSVANIQSLASPLIVSKTLRILDLSNSDLSKSLRVLCEAISSNRSIISLSLRSCKLTDTAMNDIAIILKSNDMLLTLNLNDNLITNKGSQILSTCLTSNNSLQNLLLRKNNLDEICIDPWLTCIVENSSLHILDLCQNNINITTDTKRHIKNLPTMCEILLEENPDNNNLSQIIQ